MDIRNIPQLKQAAGQRLETARDPQRIILIYSGIITLLSLAVTAICYWLDLQISQQGGLSNMGTRTLLSTFSTLLPLVSNMALMCLELGFLAAMLRISRGLYTSPQTLRAGMSRFWAMIRASLFLLLIYFGAAMASFYLASMIYALTPLSNKAVAILEPFMASADPTTLVLEDALILELGYAMLPAFILFGVLYVAIMIPISYQYRMVNFLLMDYPQMGAMAAIHISKRMMRRNRFALFKLDLSLWWYYLLSLLATALCYADSLLPLLGIRLPFSGAFGYFFFYILYLAALFAIHWFFRSKVGVTYALAYEALKPKEEKSEGVVLGNIFQA